MASTANRYQGFTLVELVVVSAILRVLSAITNPFITSHLGQSKDRERFQQAVDAYFSEPDNVNFLGKPQFPIMGTAKTAGTFIRADHNHDTDHPDSHDHHNQSHGSTTGNQAHHHTRISEDLTDLGNPLGGTQGGNPKWIDDDNGIRDAVEEELLDSDSNSLDKPGWHVAIINREGTQYIVDSRDYFIDFDKLVGKGLLDEVPRSASTDNRPEDPPTSIPLSLPDNGTPGRLTITPPTSTVALWVVDENSDKVFRYSLEGPLLDSFSLNSANQKSKGITTDGISLWVLDKADKKVYRYSLNGSFQDSFALTEPSNHLEGITTDGTSLWVLDKDAGVARYSIAGVFQQDSFSLDPENSHAEGITTDGTSLWVVDEDTDKVFRYTPSGSLITSFSVAPATHPEGIAYDGTNVWVVDKETDKMYPFNSNGGTPGAVATGLYTGSYSWYVDGEGKVKSLSFFFPEADKTGFQTAYP